MGVEKTIKTKHTDFTGIYSFESHRKRCSNRWNCTFSVHSFRQMLEHLWSQGLRCCDPIGLQRQHHWTKDSRRPCITPSNFNLQTSVSLTWFRSLGLHYDFFSLFHNVTPFIVQPDFYPSAYLEEYKGNFLRYPHPSAQPLGQSLMSSSFAGSSWPISQAKLSYFHL